MPYFVTDSSPDCSGWATIKEDGEVMGCHTTKQQAIDQMVAISLAEEIEPGGERIEKQKRVLPDNYRPSLSQDVPEGRACGNCIFYKEDDVKEFANGELRAWCEKWDDYVNGAYYCNAWQPAEEIEEDLEDELEESRQVNLTPPAYMRAAARRGLELNRQGFGGDGLTDKTKQEARDMADGRVSEDKWRRIAPWIARHLVDLNAPQNNNPDDPGYPGAGLVAHYLWGSGPSKRAAQRTRDYAQGVIDRLDAEEERHGSHDQGAHGNWSQGGGAEYKSGNWGKATTEQKQQILERQYGMAADLAQGDLPREQKIQALAQMDNNDDLVKAEVYINGNHSVAFKGTSKSLDMETKQAILKDVDNLQEKSPLNSIQVDVVARVPSNVAQKSNFKASGYTHSNGKKIVLMKDAAGDRDTLAGTKIQLTDPNWHMPTYRNSVSKGTYTLNHEWGHALDLQTNKSGTLDFESKVDMAVKRGLSKGGFMSTYGKTNLSEAYAEGFAEFIATNKSSTNQVVLELSKEFSW